MFSLVNLYPLSVIIFLPGVGALALLLFPQARQRSIKLFALGVTLADFLLSLLLYARFDPAYPGMQFQEAYPWIMQWGIWYRLGVDGSSLFLVLLTTFLSVLAIASSWNAITQRVKEYMAFMLLLETGMLGVFCALDMFLFYVFWEAMLVPMYFVIGVWGGPNRIYAAVKFFLYTMAGGVLMLVGILALYFFYHAQTGAYSFNWEDWRQFRLPAGKELWLFGAFAVAFAIKVPMLPFHTWLPDAHVEAPTAGSVILAGVLLKMGAYGFVRFCLPFFPNASVVLAPLIGVIAVGGIIYGAVVAAVQSDVKRLVAYSSVAHMGFVMLGIFALTPEGVAGASLQMVNHGLSTGALFLIVGMLYERRHTRMIGEFGGLSRTMPLLSVFFLLVAFSSLGLPGLNGFVGEFLVLVGSFVKRAAYDVQFPGAPMLLHMRHPGVALVSVAAGGVILAAIYILWMFRRVMHGPITRPENRSLRDLSWREIGILLPVAAAIVFIGVYPKPFLSRIEPSTVALVQKVFPAGLPAESRSVRSAAADRVPPQCRLAPAAADVTTAQHSHAAQTTAAGGAQWPVAKWPARTSSDSSALHSALGTPHLEVRWR